MKYTPKILSVSQLGSDCLRGKSNKVEKITAEVKQLVSELITTLEDNDGVGIAAPQVNRSISLFIIASKPSDRYPDAPEMKPLAIINPKLISHSKKIVKDWEGCMSVPGIRGLVGRYSKIKVEFMTLQGKKKIEEFEGFVARIFQHEYDHLNGLVYLDRLESNRDIISDKEFKKILQDKRKK